MLKIIEIAIREYLATVKTKTFLVSLCITPMVIVLIQFLDNRTNPTYVTERVPQKIVIIDQVGTLENEIKQVFSEHNQGKPMHQIIIKNYIEDYLSSNKYIEKCVKEICDGKLDAYLSIDEENSNGTISLKFYSKKRASSDFTMFDTVKMLISEAVLYQKYKFHNFSHDLIESLHQNINVQHLKAFTQLDSNQNSDSAVLTFFFYMYIMYMGIFSTSQRIISSLIEEKNTRIMEVLLSILTPCQLIAGKIFGLAAVGLTLVGFWLSIVHFFLMKVGIIEILSVTVISYFFVYYILGFLLISSLAAAIGSVCNSNKEAHNFSILISLLLALPMFVCTYVFENPDSILAIFLSFFPLTAPITMVQRILFSAEVNHPYAMLSIFLLIVSIFISIQFSAKILRTGILIYGKPLKIREILRWLKHK